MNLMNFSQDIMDIDFDSLDIITREIDRYGEAIQNAENVGIFEIGMIIDFMKDYYGKTVIVEFVKKSTYPDAHFIVSTYNN